VGNERSRRPDTLHDDRDVIQPHAGVQEDALYRSGKFDRRNRAAC
jgi:hypothetical protein